MATTKKTVDETNIEEIVTEEVKTEEVKTPKKKKIEADETIEVRLPRLSGVNANQDEFFSVNYKNYIIKRGEYVKVPKELYEVIRNGEKAEEAAFKFAEAQAAKEA